MTARPELQTLPCPLIVMAKAPQAGFAKTRLIPALGAAGAAALAERMLGHALRQALAAGLGPVDLCCAPDAQHPAFAQACAAVAGLGETSRLTLSPQGQGDLGARMQRAFERWLPQPGGVLMMGTDIPALDARVLQQAALALQSTDAVFVPAADGGYALIGLRRNLNSIFIDMPWSTSNVMRLTRQRLQAAGWHCLELVPLQDIDEPADLAHLPPGWLLPPLT